MRKISVIFSILLFAMVLVFHTSSTLRVEGAQAAFKKGIPDRFQDELERIKEDSKEIGGDVKSFKAYEVNELINANRLTLDELTDTVNNMTSVNDLGSVVAEGLDLIAERYEEINSFSNDFISQKAKLEQRMDDMIARNTRLVDDNDVEIDRVDSILTDLNDSLKTAQSDLEKSKLESDISTRESEKKQNEDFKIKLEELQTNLEEFKVKALEALDIIELLLYQYGNTATTYRNTANYVESISEIAQINNSLSETLKELDLFSGRSSDLSKELALLDDLIEDIENL